MSDDDGPPDEIKIYKKPPPPRPTFCDNFRQASFAQLAANKATSTAKLLVNHFGHGQPQLGQLGHEQGHGYRGRGRGGGGKNRGFPSQNHQQTRSYSGQNQNQQQQNHQQIRGRGGRGRGAFNYNQNNNFNQGQFNHQQQQFNNNQAQHQQQQSRFNDNNYHNYNNDSGQVRGRGHSQHQQHHQNPQFSNYPRGRGGQRGGQRDGGGGGPICHKPWMTPELVSIIEKRNTQQVKAFKSGSIDDLNEFKSLKNQASQLVDTLKSTFEQDPCNIIFANASMGFVFSCGPCNRNFKNQIELDKHKAEHMTCKLDGCTFTAHPKLILKHIEMQHSNNLFQRLKGFETPEEMEKWRQERRSRFPTTERAQQIALEKEELKKVRELRRIQISKESQERKLKQLEAANLRISQQKLRKEQKKPPTEGEETLVEDGQSSSQDKVPIKAPVERVRIKREPIIRTPYRNTSKILLLETYDSCVEWNSEKNKLIGKRPMNWSQGGKNQKLESEFDFESDSEDSSEDGDNCEITDDEECDIDTISVVDGDGEVEDGEIIDNQEQVEPNLDEIVQEKAKNLFSLSSLVAYADEEEDTGSDSDDF